ncbi:galactofuranose ABC transporter, permease protein YjfF [Nocardia aurantia]|uniref:Sugar ABC transporter permease YjfF n=1 Tax=Nocardia aurantia TaxID=2585199 RepID=A0A7K0DIE7_9NOCA|nr:galactofuranose ABC transporter, permease protein YjfF [Nocardia aurantia]MQY25479.1 hypothetical protein [Nocardia aurantia]
MNAASTPSPRTASASTENAAAPPNPDATETYNVAPQPESDHATPAESGDAAPGPDAGHTPARAYSGSAPPQPGPEPDHPVPHGDSNSIVPQPVQADTAIEELPRPTDITLHSMAPPETGVVARQSKTGAAWRWARAVRGNRYVPVLATAVLFAIMYAVGVARYPAFGYPQVFVNLFIDNAFLLVLAVGMTFVILTGGIDLSVGAVLALTTVVSAWLVTQHGWPAAVVMPSMLAGGTLFGAGMGAVIQYFEIQPFIVTLAGMFLARGLAYVISTDSTTITDGTYTRLAQQRIHLGSEVFLSIGMLVALAVVAVAFVVLHYTRLGRTVYALGGNEQSALMMGLPVARTKVTVYAISGFCSALGGILFTLYTLSGWSLHAVGMELDAIASVVIGGTLLTGGSGFVLGTVLGVLTLGVIQTIISFQGTLSSWWTRIVIGALLLVFILLQRLLSGSRTR